MSKKLYVVLALAIMLPAAYFYLFCVDRIPVQPVFAIDWQQVQALAGDGGPVAVHSEKIADAAFFSWMQVAGAGWQRVPMEFRTFQLVYGDGHTIMIDAVHDAAKHHSTPLMLGYDDRAFAHQQQALREADKIVVTHEHFDHIGGLLSFMNDAVVVGRMFIPAAQRHSPEIRAVGFDDAMLARLPAFDYQGMHQLAPGVVLIAAPGHTEGNQIIYVRLADGNEYAFIGDIAWNGRNYRERRAKSILINVVAHENAAQLNDQIAYFADLMHTSAMHFVIAHDAQMNRELVDKGLIREGLVLRGGTSHSSGNP